MYGSPVAVIDPESAYKSTSVPLGESDIVKSVPLTSTVLTKYNVLAMTPPNVVPVKVIGIPT